MRHLAEDKFGIKCNAMLFQQGDELFFKSAFFVMLSLIPDVLNDGGDVGTADAKRSVSLLPREFAILFVRPSRRIRFDGENCLGQRQSGRDLDKKMNVVLNAAYRMNVDVEFFANARHV